MDFSSKLQSSMTIFHHKLLTREGRVTANGWTHPSSMTVFVHLFIRNVIQKVTGVRKGLCDMIYDQQSMHGECRSLSYRWTGRVWGRTGWSSRLEENHRSFQRDFEEHFRVREYASKSTKKTRKMATCNLLKTPGSRPTMPNNYPPTLPAIIVTVELHVLSNVREEPAASCRWTGWVPETTDWSSRLQEENSRIISEEPVEQYTPSNECNWNPGRRCEHVTRWI